MRGALRKPAVAAAVAAFVAGACRAQPAPYGEALFVVDTDVAVPARVNRLRVDVLAEDGRILSSRDVLAATRAEWPVSFSVVGGDEDARAAFVRLRAYPEGHVVPTPVTTAPDAGTDDAPAEAARTSMEDACRNAPELRLEQPLVVRRGATPITSVLPYTTRDGTTVCTRETRAGSAVARFTVTEADAYVLEVIHATPDGARGEPGGDTTLSIRRDCLFPTAQLACADDIGGDDLLSKLVVSLPVGTYWVVTGGAEPAAADLTLLASRPSTAQPVPSPPRSPAATLAPDPGVTIDRLVALSLPPAVRGTVEVVLHGECFGSPADLAGRTTCLDRDDARAQVIPEPLAPGLRRTLSAAPGAWRADAAAPCTTPPRPESTILDDEVCIPGGAFVLGDTLALNDGDLASHPERMRVVEPFLLDRHEVTVGRYRDALAKGYVPVSPPSAEPGQLRAGHMCTWNVGAKPTEPAAGIDRERLPLTCVSWQEAHAFCTFLGGDLPTEDEWEYAATASGRAIETPYPWGRDLPTCDRAVFARSYPPFDECSGVGLGPAPADAPALDRSPEGVIGLAGNVQEWLATPFAPYGARAWRSAGLRRPVRDDDAPLRATRGTDWATGPLFAVGSARRAAPPLATYDNLGFRCARRGR